MNLIKKLALCVTLVSVMLSSALVFARITHTLLVFDARNEAELPGRFRTSSDALPENTNFTKDGLENLHEAGSQQFSKESLMKALEKIPSTSVVVIDLRRESHGLIDGNAVSWYGPQNAANANKSSSQIITSENRLLMRLKKSHYRWVYQIIEKSNDDYVDKASREFIPVRGVQSEQQLAEGLHLGYQRFYVEDFHAPRNDDVVRFVNFAKRIPENTWLYFHCRAGRGRTTTFMAMYDMMKNAKQVSFEDILNRQAAIGGVDLQKLPSEGNFKYRYASDRLNFLKNFYDYTKENKDNFATTWAQWVRKSH